VKLFGNRSSQALPVVGFALPYHCSGASLPSAISRSATASTSRLASARVSEICSCAIV